MTGGFHSGLSDQCNGDLPPSLSTSFLPNVLTALHTDRANLIDIEFSRTQYVLNSPLYQLAKMWNKWQTELR